MCLGAVERGSELRLVAAVVVERVSDDGLLRSIDCGLRVIALDVTILGLQDAALRFGEVALRLAVLLLFRRRRWLAGLLAAFFLALLFRLFAASHLFCGGGFGFRLQLRLGGTDLRNPLLLVGHPVGHLVATLVAVELVFLRKIGRASCRVRA